MTADEPGGRLAGEASWWARTARIMRGNILILTLTGVLGMFARSMAFPYASLYILSLGGEPAQIGLINSLAPLAGLVLFPLAGYLADRTSRVKMIGYVGIASGLVFLIYMLAPSWHWIALGTFLRGMMVIQFPASSALVADSLTPRNRGRGIAAMNTLSGAPAMLAPLAAGALLDFTGVDSGMRYLYGVLAVAYIASALINLRLLEETTTHHEPIRLTALPFLLKSAYAAVPDTLRRLPRTIKAQAVVIILGFVSNAIAGPFWVVYAVEQIGLSSSQWGAILLIGTALRTLGYIPAGGIVDRYGRAACMRVALAISVVSVPLFVYAHTFFAVLAIRAAVALANALFGPASVALMADAVPRDMRGRAMAAIGRGSIMIGATGGGGGGPGLGFLITLPLMLASIGAGYLYAYNTHYPWYLAFAALGLCLLVALVFIRDPREAEV